MSEHNTELDGKKGLLVDATVSVQCITDTSGCTFVELTGPIKKSIFAQVDIDATCIPVAASCPTPPDGGSPEVA